MKVITFQDIVNLSLRPKQIFNWAEEMICQKKSCLLPPKISIRPMEGVFCNVMPCMIGTDGNPRWGGAKIVTRYPGRNPSLDGKIIIFDARNGEYLALLDGDWITAMRTGAVAAHSIQLFAKEDYSVVGVMGLGNTARATLLILSDLIGNKELEIKLLSYKGQEELFIRRFKDEPHFHFEIVDNTYNLIKGSDVVISGATYLPNNVCTDVTAYDEGILVIPIHTLGFKNCDLFFDKVYADDFGHVQHFEHFKKFKQFAEVSDVVNGYKSGREVDSERILVYNIGISIHDINFAVHIYDLLKDDRTLPEIDLKGPTEKYWL